MSARLSWTPERVQTLSTLWLDGRSASEVARALGGGATRNAVIGKVHRLGLGGRERPSAPQARVIHAPAARRRRAVASTPAPRPNIVQQFVQAPQVDLEPLCGLATVLTVTVHACRWPFGDPVSDHFALCGRPAVRGAYCAQHGAMAFRPVA